jgi:hypothetical protein
LAHNFFSVVFAATNRYRLDDDVRVRIGWRSSRGRVSLKSEVSGDPRKKWEENIEKSALREAATVHELQDF